MEKQLGFMPRLYKRWHKCVLDNSYEIGEFNNNHK